MFCDIIDAWRHMTHMTWSIDEWNGKPFMRWAGLRVVSASSGSACVDLEVQDHHRGGGGTSAINGAILAYMHDVVQGVALSSIFEPAVQRMATLHLNVEYPKLLLCETTARVEARVLRMGQSIAFCESEFRDKRGDVCSRSTATYHIKRRRPQGQLGAAPTLHAEARSQSAVSTSTRIE
jgi:acyl-coenzyme A thioesterase PaaI-like protein